MREKEKERQVLAVRAPHLDYMVKKTLEWQSAGSIHTLSQVRSYVESCKDWLMALPKESDTTEDKDDVDIGVVRDSDFDIAPAFYDNTGLVQEQIVFANKFYCFVCNASSSITETNIVTANPFSRAQCLLFCQECLKT